MIRAIEKENLQFLREQNGEIECKFKSAIFSFFHGKITQVRAYLARVTLHCVLEAKIIRNFY